MSVLIFFLFSYFQGRPPLGSIEQSFLEKLEKQGDIPVIIIATVSGIITFMLLFAIVATMACVIYKRKRKGEQLKGLQKAPSEGTVLFLFFVYSIFFFSFYKTHTRFRLSIF